MQKFLSILAKLIYKMKCVLIREWQAMLPTADKRAKLRRGGCSQQGNTRDASGSADHSAP